VNEQPRLDFDSQEAAQQRSFLRASEFNPAYTVAGGGNAAGPPLPTWLTIAEAAGRLAINREQARALATTSRLGSKWASNKWLLLREDVEQFAGLAEKRRAEVIQQALAKHADGVRGRVRQVAAEPAAAVPAPAQPDRSATPPVPLVAVAGTVSTGVPAVQCEPLPEWQWTPAEAWQPVGFVAVNLAWAALVLAVWWVTAQ
jgi:hypothetical protein